MNNGRKDQQLNIWLCKFKSRFTTLEKLITLIPTESSNKIELFPVGTCIDISNISLELLDREKKEQKHMAPSMFSYYSLDASVMKTVVATNDSCVGLITLNLNDLKVISLTNCMKSKGKYTKIKAGNVEIYAKHQELACGLSPNILEIIIDKTESEETVISLSNFLISSLIEKSEIVTISTISCPISFIASSIFLLKYGNKCLETTCSKDVSSSFLSFNAFSLVAISVRMILAIGYILCWKVVLCINSSIMIKESLSILNNPGNDLFPAINPACHNSALIFGSLSNFQVNS